MKRLVLPYLPALGVVVVTIVLTAIFGALYVSGVAQSAKEDFYALTSLTSQIFAESIRPDMTEEQLQNITQSFVRGDVLYAQVVVNRQVLFEDRIDSVSSVELLLTDATDRFQQRELNLPSGTPYLDVIRPLMGSSDNFIRIGFSMREIENRVLNETLFVIQLGLAAVLIVGLISGLFLWLVNKQPASVLEETPAQAYSAGVELDGHDGHQVPGTTEIPHRIFEVGPLLIDYTSKVVSVNGDPVELSPKEFDLVTLLATNPGKVFSNDEILQSVWADGFSATSKDVKQYIYLLRRKLEPDPEHPALIVTVRGFGYKLETGQNGQT